jgi:hypothetical protein
LSEAKPIVVTLGFDGYRFAQLILRVRSRVPDAVQRFFSGAPQIRDPSICCGWAPDQQRTTPKYGVLRSIRGTVHAQA